MDYPQIVTTITEGLPPVSSIVDAPWVSVTSINGMTGDVIVEPIILPFQSYHYYLKDNVITYNGSICFAKQTFTSGESFDANDWNIPDFAQEQADWNENDSTAKSYIKNKPTIPDPTDYYWANQKVSDTSKNNTTPTFATATFNGSTQNIIGNGSLLRFAAKQGNASGTGSIVLGIDQFRPINAESTNINLGYSGSQWKNLYLSGDIYKSNNKLTLPSQAGTVALTSDLPTVNDATLTIQKNSTTIDTFTANASSNKTVNISVPTDTGDLTNNAGYLKATDIYPIGSVVTFYDNADHSSFLGLTWERFAAGKMVVGYDSTDTDFSTIGNTGGEKTHQLSTQEMPRHNHLHGQVYSGYHLYQGGSAPNGVYTGYAVSDPTSYTGGDSNGNTVAHNNMPPYVTAALWRRTA